MKCIVMVLAFSMSLDAMETPILSNALCDFLGTPIGQLVIDVINNNEDAVRNAQVSHHALVGDYGYGPATILTVACARSNASIVRCLLDMGMAQAVNQSRALSTALQHDNCDALEVLLESGLVDVHARTREQIPLMLAQSGRAARMLIAYGARVNERNMDGKNALYYAKDTSLIRALWLSGCEIQATQIWPDPRIGTIPIIKFTHELGDNILQAQFDEGAFWLSSGVKQRITYLLKHGANHLIRGAYGLMPHEYCLMRKGNSGLELAVALRDNPFRKNRVMLLRKMFDAHCEKSRKIYENTHYISEYIINILYSEDSFVSQRDQRELELLGVLPT